MDPNPYLVEVEGEVRKSESSLLNSTNFAWIFHFVAGILLTSWRRFVRHECVAIDRAEELLTADFAEFNRSCPERFRIGEANARETFDSRVLQMRRGEPISEPVRPIVVREESAQERTLREEKAQKDAAAQALIDQHAESNRKIKHASEQEALLAPAFHRQLVSMSGHRDTEVSPPPKRTIATWSVAVALALIAGGIEFFLNLPILGAGTDPITGAILAFCIVAGTIALYGALAVRLRRYMAYLEAAAEYRKNPDPDFPAPRIPKEDLHYVRGLIVSSVAWTIGLFAMRAWFAHNAHMGVSDFVGVVMVVVVSLAYAIYHYWQLADPFTKEQYAKLALVQNAYADAQAERTNEQKQARQLPSLPALEEKKESVAKTLAPADSHVVEGVVVSESVPQRVSTRRSVEVVRSIFGWYQEEVQLTVKKLTDEAAALAQRRDDLMAQGRRFDDALDTYVNWYRVKINLLVHQIARDHELSAEWLPSEEDLNDAVQTLEDAMKRVRNLDSLSQLRTSTIAFKPDETLVITRTTMLSRYHDLLKGSEVRQIGGLKRDIETDTTPDDDDDADDSGEEK